MQVCWRGCKQCVTGRSARPSPLPTASPLPAVPPLRRQPRPPALHHLSLLWLPAGEERGDRMRWNNANQAR